MQPLRLRNGESANHYFGDFWVRAVERQIACETVTTMVTKDGAMVVDFGEVMPDDPSLSQPRAGENIITGGRVYFSIAGTELIA